MNSLEYLSKITKRIPLEKFPIFPTHMEPIFGKWFQVESEMIEGWIFYMREDYIVQILGLDINNPPLLPILIQFGVYDPESDGYESIDNIPEDMASESLKALYPTSILPLLLLGGVLFLIPVIKRFKY